MLINHLGLYAHLAVPFLLLAPNKLNVVLYASHYVTPFICGLVPLLSLQRSHCCDAVATFACFAVYIVVERLRVCFNYIM